MKMLSQQELITMAKAHGLFEQSPEVNFEPVNRAGQDTATKGLPAYAADVTDEKGKRREIMIRRLRKILLANRQRVAETTFRQAYHTSLHRDVIHESLKGEKTKMLDRLKDLGDKPEYWNLSASDAAH